MRRGLIVGVGLVQALLTSQATAQKITPRFAWPANTVAEISGGGYSITERNGQRDSTSRATTSTLDVRAHPDGFLITSGPTSGAMIDLGATTEGASMEALLRARSSYIVDREGTFLRLDDIDAVKRRADSAMAPMLERMSGMSPGLAQSMREANSEATLNAGARYGWQQLVGSIFGRSWALGDSLRSSFQQPMPGAPGASLVQLLTVTYTGVIACPAESGARTCWQFDSRTEMDMSAVRVSVRRMLADMGMTDPNAADQVPIPETTMKGSIVVDAATGRPLQVTSSASSRMNAMAAGMDLSFSTRYQSTVSYRWRPLD